MDQNHLVKREFVVCWVGNESNFDSPRLPNNSNFNVRTFLASKSECTFSNKVNLSAYWHVVTHAWLWWVKASEQDFITFQNAKPTPNQSVVSTCFTPRWVGWIESIQSDVRNAESLIIKVKAGVQLIPCSSLHIRVTARPPVSCSEINRNR